ncbi:MAG: hypothetical protein SOV58_01010 [Candidatus Enteromonas sp.]|nr:hypothetical protein [Candidatus Enteromonas sp.]
MIDTDKAYLFGLLIGGGVFGAENGSFLIQLPYNAWGSIEKNPQRAAEIGQSILNVVKATFEGTYGITCSYNINKGKWIIYCSGNLQSLKNELASYGITAAGELRKSANIDQLVAALTNDGLKRRFLAGLADTIGSLSASQRRFTSDFAIISFEFNGFNFDLIFTICQLLCSLGLYPDQIEWNHPNFQSGDDAYYESWKKGCKLRVALDDYSTYGKFAFKPKAKAMKAEIDKQTKGTNSSIPCNLKNVIFKFGCTHFGENCPDLPKGIRGYHFLNPKHICYILGCPRAPKEQVEAALIHPEEYVTPFTILTKGTLTSINSIINSDDFYSQLIFEPHAYLVKDLYNLYLEKPNHLLFGNSNVSGYPIANIIGAIAYLLADKNDLFGKRIRGSQFDLIERKIKANPDLTIDVRLPDFVSVMILRRGTKACLVGAKHPQLTRKLFVFDGNDRSKFYLRRPTKDDYSE